MRMIGRCLSIQAAVVLLGAVSPSIGHPAEQQAARNEDSVRTITLKGQPFFPDAGGRLELKEAQEGKRAASITVWSVKGNALYSIWVPIGPRTFWTGSFRTDQTGKAERQRVFLEEVGPEDFDETRPLAPFEGKQAIVFLHLEIDPDSPETPNRNLLHPYNFNNLMVKAALVSVE